MKNSSGSAALLLLPLMLSSCMSLGAFSPSTSVLDKFGDCTTPIACNIPDGPVDYWSTPAETCARGGGDCDDFAAIDFFKFEDQGAWFVVGWVDGLGHAWVEIDGVILDSCYVGGTRVVYLYLRRGVFVTPDGRIGNPSGLTRWTDLLRRQDAYIEQQETSHE